MSTNNTNIQNGIIEEDKRRAEAEARGKLLSNLYGNNTNGNVNINAPTNTTTTATTTNSTIDSSASHITDTKHNHLADYIKQVADNARHGQYGQQVQNAINHEHKQ